jgi:hypothetical protein
MTEVQVFRLESFDKKKWYETASYTRREGLYPNDRYYTTFPLRNMGHYLRSERWGYGDGGGGREVFTLGYVEMDYNGTVCFRERKGIKMTKAEKFHVITVGRNSKVKLPPDVQRYIAGF